MPILGGACKLNQELGTDPKFSARSFSIEDTSDLNFDAEASFQLRSDGTIWRIRDFQPDDQIGRWDNGIGSLTISDYDFRMSTTSGSSNTGSSTDVWILGVNLLSWGVRIISGITSSPQNYEGEIQVRPTGGGANYDVADVTLLAQEI